MDTSAIDGFQLIGNVDVNENIKVKKYRSNRTSLLIYFGEVDGPTVNSYYALGTEAFDDDGLPHTLEHLVFLGSEDYPYKGVLDMLANMCLASGTNAWTDTDHTCYTLSTAGSQGFIQFLPIYLDHVLYPTITESGFITEVHHIDGEGQDAGIVYCEMQACENKSESLVERTLQHELFPVDCGYRSNTGGVMKNLRETCSYQKVKDYHRKFYRPENLSIIITGNVDIKHTLSVIHDFEEKMLKQAPRYDLQFSRPWQTPIPALKASVTRVITFPSEEEKRGSVSIAWIGPFIFDPASDLIDVLFEYLCKGSISPFSKAFIENDDPLCSTVSLQYTNCSKVVMELTFGNVLTERISEVKDKALNLIKEFADGTRKMNMNRLHSEIQTAIQSRLLELEDDPHETVANSIIQEFLYGTEASHLQDCLSDVAVLKDGLSKPALYWQNLLSTYFIKKPYVAVLAVPSRSHMEHLSTEENSRLAQQKQQLGETGLKLKAEQLEKAIEQNELDPPDDLFSKVEIPGLDGIHFHNVERYGNISDIPRVGNTALGDHSTEILQTEPAGSPRSKSPRLEADSQLVAEVNQLPISLAFDHGKTDFVDIELHFDTRGLTTWRQRLLLELLSSLVFECPIMRNGEAMDYESVVEGLRRDSINYGCGIGLNNMSMLAVGHVSTIFNVRLKCSREKYRACIAWLRDVIFHHYFNDHRIRTIAQKIVGEISELRRSGATVATALYNDLTYTKESNVPVVCMLRQENVLNKILKSVDTSKLQTELRDLGKQLFRPEHCIVFINAHADRLRKTLGSNKILEPWSSFFPHSLGSYKAKQVPRPMKDMRLDCNRNILCGVGAVETQYMKLTTPALRSEANVEAAPLLVFIQYLSQLEGPMWRQIRGAGFAYHYHLGLQTDRGNAVLILGKASNLPAAYNEAKDVILSNCDGSGEIDEDEFEAAKSSLIFEAIDREATIGEAMSQATLHYYEDLPIAHNRQFMMRVKAVTIAEAEAAGRKYLPSLFSLDKSMCVVTCNPSKIDEISKELADLGRKFEVFTSIEDTFLGDLEPKTAKKVAKK